MVIYRDNIKPLLDRVGFYYLLVLKIVKAFCLVFLHTQKRTRVRTYKTRQATILCDLNFHVFTLNRGIFIRYVERIKTVLIRDTLYVLESCQQIKSVKDRNQLIYHKTFLKLKFKSKTLVVSINVRDWFIETKNRRVGRKFTRHFFVGAVPKNVPFRCDQS